MLNVSNAVHFDRDANAEFSFEISECCTGESRLLLGFQAEPSKMGMQSRSIQKSNARRNAQCSPGQCCVVWCGCIRLCNSPYAEELSPVS